jgi:hypothetical protein
MSLAGGRRRRDEIQSRTVRRGTSSCLLMAVACIPAACKASARATVSSV